MKLNVLESIRTNNFEDDHVMEKITDMWGRASKDLVEHESNTYGIYHEYEGDYTGDYSLCVAIEGSKEPSITIPDDREYEVFSVDSNEEQGILKTWNEIWNKEKEGTLQRAYTVDFEKYNPSGTVQIYIAIK